MTPPQDVQVAQAIELSVLGVAVICTILAGVVVTFVLLKLAQHPPATLLIVVMSMITLTLIAAFILVGNDQPGEHGVLGTMAASSLGSLGTAITYQLREQFPYRMVRKGEEENGSPDRGRPERDPS